MSLSYSMGLVAAHLFIVTPHPRNELCIYTRKKYQPISKFKETLFQTMHVVFVKI